MKFGETFTVYLQAHQERFIEESCHVEYKRLKKVLKSCRICRDLKGSSDYNGEDDDSSLCCQYGSCPMCDKKFFSELTKEASDIAGCFSSRVRRLRSLQDHGVKRYISSVCQCFTTPHIIKAKECQMLVEYAMMNAVAMRKILKKYDKVHSSDDGKKFKSKMRAGHIEILQSPWLLELGAFSINLNESSSGNSDELLNPFCCDLSTTEPTMTLKLPDNMKLEYNLICAICLELVFNPYALSCGHIFCKLCACSASSVMIFQGLKAADSKSKCPVCREAGVYCNAVHLIELALLLKNHCKDYWKERLAAERAGEAIKVILGFAIQVHDWLWISFILIKYFMNENQNS